MRSALSTVFLLATLFASSVGAQPVANPMAAIRAGDWPNAEKVAAASPDPIALTLVAYFRALAPGAPERDGASAAEISHFAAEHPNWPGQAQLSRRREEALASEPDDERARAACRQRPVTAPALLRCARAAPNLVEAANYAVAAWVGVGITDPAAEAAFTKSWSGALGPADEWARFDALAWAAGAQPSSTSPSSPALAARRQLTRLNPMQRTLAALRLGLQRGDEIALGNAATPREPSLFLNQARALRRADRDADAAALWLAQGEAAQAAYPTHAAEFWTERNLLARRLLRAGDADTACALVEAHGQTGVEAAAEAEFLAGFIALRRLNDAARARSHFERLRGLSAAAITQARANYWLARATQLANDDPRPAFERAAAYPQTFYGQLAILALGNDAADLSAKIDAMRDPAWSEDRGWDYASGDLSRAATMLMAWAEPRQAASFMLRAADLAPAAETRAFIATLAAREGLPDVAVGIARRMGREGQVLPEQGWPVAFMPPPGVEAALALGIMRQESSFDSGAVSSAGARGLMQLMPATAQAIARDRHETVTLATLTADPQVNMRLGSAYLADMLETFAGSVPLAVAAYNAGPNRVREWLTQNGDPRNAGPVGMIDWIELIPFSETRNYVQRVLENTIIYRARLRQSGPPLLARGAS